MKLFVEEGLSMCPPGGRRSGLRVVWTLQLGRPGHGDVVVLGRTGLGPAVREFWHSDVAPGPVSDQYLDVSTVQQWTYPNGAIL
jgi:hypothetical protein